MDLKWSIYVLLIMFGLGGIISCLCIILGLGGWDRSGLVVEPFSIW